MIADTAHSATRRLQLGGSAAAIMDMVIQWMPRPVWARVRTKGRRALRLDEYPHGIPPHPGRAPRTDRGFHATRV
jgi:hypothetical protein